MPNFTVDQMKAINTEGNNIIVSAGAGSGKTAVLTERVLRKLKEGISINNLLVLTFTNEAAREMKNRTRIKIMGEPSIHDQLQYIDACYITTFDSYALSLVKKYHYLLGVSNDVTIVDANIIECFLNNELDNIFEEMYERKDAAFLEFVEKFCISDDSMIKQGIKNISSALNMKYDKQNYLNNYINDYYSDKYLNDLVREYENIIEIKIRTIEDLLDTMKHLVNANFYNKYYEALENLFSAQDYDQYKQFLPSNLPVAYKNMDESAKNIKQQIADLLKEIKELLIYDNKEDIIKALKLTKNDVQLVIKIILELDRRLDEYKFKNDVYEFIDINKLAIKLVSEYDDVCQEIKECYNEIMIDEYQDTNDLQDLFISKIANHNVYMVGDIKQSIYRFRNANPDIFKKKYDNFSNDKDGIKIDLLKNFRSRREVIDNINLIFSKIMDDKLGGADYLNSHQMQFGNINYEDSGKTKQDNNLDILKYSAVDGYTKEELEAFIIGNDIKNKIKGKYQIFDKDTNQLRPIKYSDICIIMDRNTSFEKYKEIFSYLQIPISVYADFKLTKEYDIMVIKNLCNLVYKIYKQEFDADFNHYYASVARSFIISSSDDIIYKQISSLSYSESDLFKKCEELAKKLEVISSSSFIDEILEIFNVYNKLFLLGDIERSIIRIDYLKELAQSLSKLGYTAISFVEYLNNIVDNNLEISYSVNNSDLNNVKIMNIHKSKGLEFNVCYYAGLYKKFNIRDLSEKFSYDNQYGIIIPYYDNGIGNTILKDLQKNRYMMEEISEKIRLFYVALTRAKEKMIMVIPETNKDDFEEKWTVDTSVKMRYRSFLDMLLSIQKPLTQHVKKIDNNLTKITKDYKNLVDNDKKHDEYTLENNTDKVTFIENHIEKIKKSAKSASKTNNELINSEIKNNMSYGKQVHELFEHLDLKNPNVPKKYEFLVKKFIQHLDLNYLQIFKEHEFVFQEDDIHYHGIIDLLLEYENKYVIIDYKLKSVVDEAYKEQVTIYKKYLRQIVTKPVETYLYSIIDGKMMRVEEENE